MKNLIIILLFCSFNLFGQQLIQLVSPMPGNRINAIHSNYWGDIFVGGPSGLFKSTDVGQTWESIFSSNINSIYVDNLSTFYISFDNTIYFTTDHGETFTQFGQSYPSIINSIGINKVLNYFYIATSTGLYKSANNGNSWEQILEGDFINVVVKGDSIAVIKKEVVSISDYSVYSSTNNGTNWSIFTVNEIPPTYESFNCLFKNNGVLFARYYVGESNVRIYRSFDWGFSWAYVQEYNNTQRHQMIAYGNESFVLSVFSTVGTSFQTQTFYFQRSNNNYSGLIPLYNSSGILILNNSGNRVSSMHGYSTNTLLFGFVNGGFYKIENVSLPVELASFTVIPNGNNIKINWSTSTETNNLGFELERKFKDNEWSNIAFVKGFGTTTEIQNYSFIDDVFLSGKYYYRLKQIDYDGTYEYSNEIEVDFNLINNYSLNQNYPNPFNPSTVVSYQLPVDSKVNLIVYDILGNEVATLVNEEKEAGVYQAIFDANNLSSGVYFYTLRAGSFVQSKKMVLMK